MTLPRRATIVTATLAALAAITGIGPAHAGGAQPDDRQSRIVTYNYKWTLPDRGLIKDLRHSILPNADVVCLNEIGDDKRIDLLPRNPAWGLHHAGHKSTPMLWRRAEFKLLDRGAMLASPRTYTTPAGAGFAWVDAKHLLWLKLRHRETGRVETYGCWHAPASVQYPSRYALHQQGGRRIAVFASHRRHAAILGDMNAAPTHPVMRPLHRVLRNAWWNRPDQATFRDGRTIDHMLTRGMRVVDADAWRGYRSDHRPVRFVVTRPQ